MWYKKIEITDDLKSKAKELQVKKKLKNSIRGGGGNFVGALGEIIVAHYMASNPKNKVTIAGDYDYDLLINGNRIEVKTKERSVEPQPHFNGSVATTNDTQECDFYMFCQIQKDHSIGYILGYMSRSEFKEKSFMLRKGEIDDGWPVKESCRNVKYIDMRRVL